MTTQITPTARCIATAGATGADAAKPEKLAGAIEEALAWLRLTPIAKLGEPALRSFTTRMPKIDLHRHLNGSIPIERLLAAARRYGVTLPADTVEGLRPLVQVTHQDKTLPDYLRKFDVIGKVLKTPGAIEMLSEACVEDAARDNLEHVEIRFSPQYMAKAHGLDLEEVIKAVSRGIKRGVQESGITARMIVVISREAGVDEGALVAAIAAKHKHLGVVAIDLAGNETSFPPGPFAEVFQTAKQAGLGITVHAGEAAGARSVRDAVTLLGADRVGHAARAEEDPNVVALMIARGVYGESCPTANAQVGAVDSYENHPLPRYLRAGMPQVLATDNPSISGITLSSEFQRAAGAFGLTLGEIEQLLQHSVDAAFLSPIERAKLGKKMSAGLAEAERRLVLEVGVERLLTVLDETMQARGVTPRSRAVILERIRDGLAQRA